MAPASVAYAACAPNCVLLPRSHNCFVLPCTDVWGTGQDIVAQIKQQLCLLLPGVSIFLDIDDLTSVDALEECIDKSQVVMIFVSQGYFKSNNCLWSDSCPQMTPCLTRMPNHDP